MHKNHLRLYHLIFCLFLFTQVFSQVSREDSFRLQIKQSKTDTAEINNMLAFAAYLLGNQVDDSTALPWLARAEDKSGKIRYAYGQGKANLIRGDYYFNTSSWDKSISAYQKAIDASAGMPGGDAKHELLFEGLIRLAEVFNYNGDYVMALENRLKALKIADSIKADNGKKISVYVSVANDFRHLNQRSKAIAYLKNAGGFLKDANDHLKLDYYYEYYQNLLLNNELAESQLLLARFDSGVTHFNLTPSQRLEFQGMSNKLHGQYALNYTRDYAAALDYFKAYLSFSRQSKNKTHIAIALNKIGIVCDSLQQYRQAIEAFRESYDICIKEQIIDYGYKSAYELSMIYEKMGDYPNAYLFSKNAYTLKDTLSSVEKLRELNFLEARYEASRKEKTIAELTLTNTEKELAVIKRNRVLIIGGIAALSFMIILGLLYRNSRNKLLLADQGQKLQQEQIRFLEHQQQVVSLQSMVNGQEAERTRIAKDLHDGLGGLFSTVKMYFSSLEHQEKGLGQNELFKKSFEMVDTAATEVRRIAHNMMPEVLLKMGLSKALFELCSNISASRMLEVIYQETGMEKRLGASTEIMLYRIIQELLNNILKHAHAKKAIVQFIKDGNRLSVTVEDDGKGFDVAEIGKANHAGMESVKSRVNYLKGKLQVDSQKNFGTTVMMDFLINE